MKFLWIGLLTLFCIVSAAASEASLELSILGRSVVEPGGVALSKPDREWLANNKVLRIGVSRPDYPPFDITTYNQEFEGITADYSVLIGHILNINVRILSYPNRAALIQALKDHRIDVIGTANDFESAIPGLVLSTPYTLDQPTLVAPADQYSIPNTSFAGKKIAMVDHYLALGTVKTYYQESQLLLFPSILNAIGAVALGDADLYLGDSVSASYLINKSYLNTLQIINYPTLKVSSFSFAMLQDNPRLLRIINTTLDSIPAMERRAIAHRWGNAAPNLAGMQRIVFSEQEQAWLKQHPRPKVLFNKNFLPFTYNDEQGNFRGLSADVLGKISLRTGITFEVGQGSSVNAMIGALRAGDYDLMPALSPSADREQDVSFTRPYLSAPLVMVVRDEQTAPRSLNQLAGKKLAIVEGNAYRETISRDFPGIQLVEVADYSRAFERLAGGSVDAVISSLTTARYIIARAYPNRLKVVSTIGTQGGQVAFAVSKTAPELLSILNKALLSIPPEELDEVASRWRRAVVLEDSYWERHHDTITAVLIATVLVIVGIFVWITSLRREVFKRKLAERALIDRLEFERVLINGTPHPIYARDRDANLLLCNKAYLDTFNVQDGSYLLGTTVVQGLLSDPVQADEYHQDYLDVMHSGEPSFKDRLLISASGQVLTIYHWMLPFRGSDGQVKGLIGGWIDVSERQRLIHQLHAAKTEADTANRAKTTFLATMSHEIRTPMNAVIGMLEMASKAAEQGVFDQVAIEVASDAAKGLLDLIGDILDIARVESGQLSITPERCNPGDLVMSVVRIFDGPAKQKSLRLQADIGSQPMPDVLIDPMRFKQVLANLLSNAIKFTAQGTVQVCMSADYDEDSMLLRVEVTDTGIGIAAADQQRLFMPFSQVNASYETANKGSGLGLMISRTLVDMMGGSLTLSSEAATGTQVVIAVRVPVFDGAAGCVAVPHVMVPTKPTPLMSILIVDDYVANRIVLSRQLTYLGHEVSEASDGVQALALWNEQPFDVIITDCNMPNMDGYQLARAIREQEQLRNEPPCLLLGFTANAVPEERQRCQQVGMDDCLFKPISLEQLNARLLSLYHVSFDAGMPDELTRDALYERLNELAGHDAPTLQRLCSELLESSHRAQVDLRHLLAADDRQALLLLAHQLKGGARLVRFDALLITCENLEAACLQQGSNAQLSRAAEEMGNHLQRLMSWLK
ncbi:transporter substrate-binding domain-containing protein [Pseudomonas fluorescens]|uniref:transporter substrate-binding domain-containing protein n=1 Tax=Pseudomonas fluorescens TaxID=294 RepID=UPI0028590061|nr:transporter substrate-binding domain-containing protein [Pseudomonas fluorescens]MDR6165567.1 two-component system sensor histidine kinase EvgS [Pseudomonas fluorescens]